MNKMPDCDKIKFYFIHIQMTRLIRVKQTKNRVLEVSRKKQQLH